MANEAVRVQPSAVAPTSAGAAQWLGMLPPAARFVLHGDSRVRAAAALVWGTAFAQDACRAVVNGERATLWLGPDEYMLLGPVGDSTGTVLTALAESLGEMPHALVDVSHRQIALRVSGAHAATILNGACPLDLAIEEFPIGMCTRTVFSKADIVLWRVAQQVFHVEVWRSFTGYVTGLLREIGREFDSES